MIALSYAKQKGTAYESAVVKYLQECGFTTPRRVALSGAAGDKGDIWLGSNPVEPSVIIECKNYAKELPYKMVEDFIEEAYTEYKNALDTNVVCNTCALLFVKRVNLGIPDSWIIWKNSWDITVRARLGDIINVDNFKERKTEEERLDKLNQLLSI